MNNKSNITVRVDAILKSQAHTLFANLGMDLSTAINIFLRQSIKHNGLPFNVNMRNLNENKTAIEDF